MDEATKQDEGFGTWAPVPGYEGVYEVSRDGRIKRVGKAAKNGKGQGGGARIGRILKTPKGRDGYLRAQLWKNGEYENFLVHRLVAAAFIGPCPDGKEVNHKDGDKTHNWWGNLEYVTRSRNMRHAYRNGLRERGENHPRAKLAAEDVRAIREMHIPGEYGCRRIARKFGVSKNTVQHILNGENWAHLE